MFNSRLLLFSVQGSFIQSKNIPNKPISSTGYLLDEALSGGEQSTPQRPIILQCLERGKEGQRMLIALRDWWQRGVNDIGTPQPDTISPIPEGLVLLEAERIARQREPGNGSPQKSVVEQINFEAPLNSTGEDIDSTPWIRPNS